MNKKGFTLIEILVVIAIIGILSTLAVGGYTSYRREALLDLSADNIVAQFYALKDKAIHGNFGETGEAKCFGLYFLRGANGFETVRSFETDHTNKKIWDEGKNDFVYQGCVSHDPAETDMGFELDENVKFVDILNGENSLDGNLLISFSPPDGKISINPSELSGKLLKIVIKYGDSDESKYKKIVEFDLSEGKAYVKNYQDAEENL